MSISIVTGFHHITGIVLINLFNRFTRTGHSFHCNGIPVVCTDGDRRIAFCIYIVTDGSRLITPCIGICTDSNGLIGILIGCGHCRIGCRSVIADND